MELPGTEEGMLLDIRELPPMPVEYAVSVVLALYDDRWLALDLESLTL